MVTRRKKKRKREISPKWVPERNGNYQDRSILKEYNQDQKSTFKLLTDAQVQQISNPEILNSNDYNEIKTYYEELEKEFEYTELKQEIIIFFNYFLF